MESWSKATNDPAGSIMMGGLSSDVFQVNPSVIGQQTLSDGFEDRFGYSFWVVRTFNEGGVKV
jgi:hypothetical protein